MSRTVSRAGDANSSDDGSSEEVVIDVTHRIHATRSPFVVGVIVECVFCVLMTRWMSENETHESPLDKIFVFAQERNFGNSVWIVFAVTVLGRLFCLVWSEKHILRRRSGRMVTFLYTLCGTMQWLFYLSAYYVEMDAASKLTRTHKVNLDIKEVPTFISKAAGGTELTKCLVEHDWNYKECDFDVQGTCALPYTPGTKYANGDCVSTLLVGNVQCCISETIAMATPQIKLFGQPCDVSTIFMVIKWMVVLLMGWTLRHGFLAGNIGERRFTQGAWLDVLDSVVFSEFLTSADVRYPAYGFTPAGRPQMRNLWPLASLYITWLTASLAVVLSRMIYTALVPTLDEDEQEQALPTESAMMEAGEQKDRGAQGFPVRVRLTDQESGDEKGCFTHCGSGVQLEQEGRALAKGPGSYLVTYADGSKPEVVSADRLGPLLDYMVDLQGIEEAADVKVSAECSGWLDCSELSKGNRYERFNHRAKVADALRSLLLLQLPFMLWRLYFDSFKLDVVSLGGNFMLIAKNFVWGLMDLAVILSCTREDASVCSWKPLEFLKMAANSQFGQVWVGPSGMVALVAEVGGSARMAQLERRKEYLQKYKEWILSERDKYSSQRDMYENPLQEAEQRLLEVEEKMHFTFP